MSSLSSRDLAEKPGASAKTRAVLEDGVPHYMGRSGDDLIFAITCTATAGEPCHLARTQLSADEGSVQRFYCLDMTRGWSVHPGIMKRRLAYQQS